MDQSALVSICIPAYNHAAYVVATIESMLAQTCGTFELLITDDCSDDETFEVIRSYDDPRIKPMRLDKRSGPSVALNETLRRARGKYIGFCASDDRWLPQKLEQQVAYLQQHPGIGGVFCRPWLIDGNGARVADNAHLLGHDFGGETYDRGQWLRRLFFSGNWICGATPLLRAEAVRATGEFDPLLLQLQDYDYWVRFLGGHELRLLPERLVEYRVFADGRNLSAQSPEKLARHIYETCLVLRHFADGIAADAVAEAQLPGHPPFSWVPGAPSRDIRLANHALLCPDSLPHFLFALDRLLHHGKTEEALIGAADERRLFSLPFFEVTGSSYAQDYFLGYVNAAALQRMLQEKQREMEALAAEHRALTVRAEPPAARLWQALRRVFGAGNGN